MKKGRAYIVGREGHIYIGDLSVSRRHAEIKFVNGRIRIRDLNSSNGTYLVKDNKPVRLKEEYVKPNQAIILGNRRYTVQGLLANVGVFAAYSDETGLVIALDRVD